MSSLHSFMAHTAALVKDLNDKYRLPPTYVGVRRVRASSKQVQSAWIGANDRVDSTAVVFKVTQKDGTERRMTTKEKKDMKIKLRKERVDTNKQQKSEKSELSEDDDAATFAPSIPNNNDSKYHQLHVDNSALEEELADLRGERHAVPPVVLSPPMALQAKLVILNQDIQRPTYRLDDELSKTWAIQLKQAIIVAEQVRKGEDLRPMAYQVVPEIWSRLRPESLRDGVTGADAAIETTTGTKDVPDESSWTFLTIRQGLHSSDIANAALVDLFYHHSHLHISCGAKFGCDYLLYDGPRCERHAFAGLRVLVGTANPYDLAAFVRGLNTAGKLALVVKVEGDGRMAIVDLALEKILSAPTHSKRKRTEVRKEAGQKLAKSRG